MSDLFSLHHNFFFFFFWTGMWWRESIWCHSEYRTGPLAASYYVRVCIQASVHIICMCAILIRHINCSIVVADTGKIFELIYIAFLCSVKTELWIAANNYCQLYQGTKKSGWIKFVLNMKVQNKINEFRTVGLCISLLAVSFRHCYL